MKTAERIQILLGEKLHHENCLKRRKHLPETIIRRHEDAISEIKKNLHELGRQIEKENQLCTI